MWAAGVGAVVLVAGAVAVGSTRLLQRSSPAPGDLSYVAATTPRFAIGTAAVSAAAGLCAIATLPCPLWLPWLGFAGIGVWLACVDVVTGYVPRLPSQSAAGIVLILVAAQSAVEGSAAPLVRALTGGVGVWLFFASLWLVARGAIGFGDVRFSLPWAMTAAAASWHHLLLAAVVGSVLALLFGLWLRIRWGLRSFPYTPGLAAGLFAAAALHAVW